MTHAIDGGGPGTWVIAPWRSDGHPDHTAAGDAAATAAADANARLLEYPIWAWHWSTPGSDVWAGVWPGVWPQGATLSVLQLSAAEQRTKHVALAGFPSQTRELSPLPGDEALLTASFLAYFRRGYETFIETSVAPAGTELAGGVSNAVPSGHGTAGGPASGDLAGVLQSPPGPTGSVTDLHGALAATRSLTEPYFNDLYAGTRDPWGFESRWYERRKRALTVAALPRPRFASVLELGCSIGVFTEQLAGRSESVLAVDISEEPLRIARERLAGHPGVDFERLTVPREWPAGAFDLIVLSEVGYYCSTADLRRLLERCRSSLTADGVLLACHWRHPVEVYPLTGDAVHAQLARVVGLQRTVHHVEYDFILEIFEPRPARSVAQREGLVS
ncbi:class I SAM-dependent methyltransferase [Cryobacterium melibiosiphilum]|uniref:Class I SAM-dependent methyltransferase n=1 Tax=Cryobacterium melibiosiphilum TaxID=995039 RepID=A0A3A5MKJ1_9MICO|nr:class I SAM-dependent methyltransferase [Cryobacterium melibiosiphilum]